LWESSGKVLLERTATMKNVQVGCSGTQYTGGTTNYDNFLYKKLLHLVVNLLKGGLYGGLMKKRTCIIGIDGVPFGLIDELSSRGVMPYVETLKEEGIFRQMSSSVPEISSVSWSSIITGKNPGEHGIYGFTDLLEGTYTLSFPHFGKLKSPPFWQNQGKFVIINVPSTYPAAPLDGFLVSGFISPDLERAVYPLQYVNTLKGFNYKIDVDTKKAQKSTSLLFKELYEALESRMKVYQFFWEKIDWDVFMMVITGSDRLEHYLWHAYEDDTHEYHNQFLEFYTKIDECIQKISEKLKKTDSLIMLSDHGMEKTTTNVNVNCYLEEKGFLIRGNNPRKGYNNIQEGTRAFALDPGRIYINKKGKYPSGCIKPEEEEGLLSELVEAFKNLEKDGQKVIKKIYTNEIYCGPYAQEGPDVVLLSNKGFNLKGGILPESVFDSNILPGKHTQEDAFLYVKGDAAVPENLSVEDVVPLLDQCMGW
jgi:predicted AlkP superfamily phosphohydrolase/phosphomutase